MTRLPVGTGHSPAHLAAIGRAALAVDADLDLVTPNSDTATPSTARTTAISHLVELVWAGWDREATVPFVGGDVVLLRHPATGEWAAVYWRWKQNHAETSDQPYDLSQWTDLKAADRRAVLVENTAMVLTGSSLLDMMDRTMRAHGFDANSQGAPDDVVAHHQARFGTSMVLMMPAVAHALVTCGHPEAGEAATLLSLGGWENMAAAARDHALAYALLAMNARAIVTLRDVTHGGHPEVFHSDPRCWGCDRADRLLTDIDFGFGVEHWDFKAEEITADFDDVVRANVSAALDGGIVAMGTPVETVQFESLISTAVSSWVRGADAAQPSAAELLALTMPGWTVEAREVFAGVGPRTSATPSADDSGVAALATATVWRHEDGSRGVSLLSEDRLQIDSWETATLSERLWFVCEFLECDFFTDPDPAELARWVDEQADVDTFGASIRDAALGFFARHGVEQLTSA